MTASQGMLYLSAADLRAVDLPPAAAREAVLAAFRAYRAGHAVSRPKLAIPLGPGHGFQSMCAASAEIGLAANKWLGMANVAPGSGLPTIHAMVMLNDHATGQLRAIMDGDVLTAIRTAAMSAAAASVLARPGSRVIGFVGCGLQAHAHLAALRDLLPGLDRVLATSRTRRSAEALLAASQLPGDVSDDPEAVIRASDIVVTSVPLTDGLQPFLDPAWLRPGAFVTSVDVGRSWLPAGLSALDLLAIDDHAQQAASPAIAPGLGPLGSFSADLAELAAGDKPGRTTPDQRTMFIFRGFALADLAVAAAIYDRARAHGIGQWLPR
jgi:ornithine cyclodeaminase/alanine dehydrogenase-like protein (mu-crystallin family)